LPIRAAGCFVFSSEKNHGAIAIGHPRHFHLLFIPVVPPLRSQSYPDQIRVKTEMFSVVFPYCASANFWAILYNICQPALESAVATTSGKKTDCEFLSSCDFFVTIMASVPQFSTKIQGKYCLSGFRDCARYACAKQHGKGNVPEDLFPNASYF
jgi:hypothetical protein